MSSVGQIGVMIQQTVVRFIQQQLDYGYFSDWVERQKSANVEAALLRDWLLAKGRMQELLTGRIRLV